MIDKRDIVTIGAGPTGYVAGIRARQLGKRVTLIESSLHFVSTHGRAWSTNEFKVQGILQITAYQCLGLNSRQN